MTKIFHPSTAINTNGTSQRMTSITAIGMLDIASRLRTLGGPRKVLALAVHFNVGHSDRCI